MSKLGFAQGLMAGLSVSTQASSKAGLRLPRMRWQGVNYGTRIRQAGTRVTTTRRRRFKKKNNNGLEINKAEGGSKCITIPYRTLPIGINCFARLMLVKIGDDWLYKFAPYNENYATYDSYDLTKMLNFSSEFTERLRTSSQYKLLGVNISISNNRMPEAGDTLSQLLLYINTEKVTVDNPKIQNNVMKLNMNTIGTKNFNFRLNQGNMVKDAIGWQEGNLLYDWAIHLHLEGLDMNVIKDVTETSIMLGTVKVTFNVLTRVQDYYKLRDPAKRINLEDKIKELDAKLSSIKIKE